jgi:hypothetical protein
MIAILGAISLQRFQKFEEGITKKEFPKIEIPEIKIPELDLGLGLKDEELKEGYKTFISPNRTLKIKYPADWQEVDRAILEKISPKIEEYKPKDSKLLFLAYQKRLIEHPPLLIIQGLALEKGLEEVIEETKRIAEKHRAELTILKRETKNEMNFFELKYKKENYVFYLNNVIVSTKERNYLITVLVSDQFKEEITPQINFIFDSIQIVQ